MRKQLIILALALTLVAPTGAVAWGGKGQYEPDTILDKQGWMWNDTDTSFGDRGNRLYLNGFATHSIGMHTEVGTGVNPNFATVQSERQSWNGRMAAMLGVWKDCNNDGFIGLGDNALLEYRATLLNRTDICKVNPAKPPGGAAAHGWAGFHNDGTWVREFIPLGLENGESSLGDANPFNMADNGARVWVDWNRPGDLPPKNRCYTFVPDKTMDTTGGMIEYIDCWDGWFLTDTWNSVAPDNTPAGKLSFRDVDHDHSQSQSQLNRPNPWGAPANESYVYVFDCSKPQTAHRDFPGDSGGVGVSQPRASPTVNPNNPKGSIAGTVNETGAAMDDCNRGNDADDQAAKKVTTEWGNSGADIAYAPARNGIAITEGEKVQTDFVLDFTEGFRPWPLALGQQNSALGYAPQDGGLSATPDGYFWMSTTVVGSDRNPYVERAAVGSPTNAIAKVQYATTYAYVSPTAVTAYALQMNPGAKAGIYGSASCGAAAGVIGADPANGWHCNPKKWWPNCSEGYSCKGTINGLPAEVNVYVGQPYNMRDVDCYDTSVKAARDLGVHYGRLTNTKCDLAP